MFKKQMLIFGNEIAPTRWLAFSITTTSSPNTEHQLLGWTWVSTNNVLYTVVLCSIGSTF